MDEQWERDSLLGGYRVLDLADQKGLLCGKILADFGADVVKVERPGGDPARRLGPFYKDIPHPEKSLFWFAYNLNKRSITLDIETIDGREIFKRLVKTADFVIESFPAGHMQELGLGYPELEKINPGLVMVSISPFGQTGPYSQYKVNDMILWALGGMMFISGDSDRPPVQVTFPQAYLHAGSESAVGAMIAHYYRELTGEGQYVDVSAQECVLWGTWQIQNSWEMNQIIRERGSHQGLRRGTGVYISNPSVWACKDGYVYGGMGGGALAAARVSAENLTKWMAETGEAGELADYDWSQWSSLTITQEEITPKHRLVEAFLAKRTKREIFEEGLKRRIAFNPICNAKDVVESPQFAARGFFVEVEHPELGATLTYCGPWLKLSETPLTVRRRPPLIGEHNEEIYKEELGLTDQQLVNLKRASVI